MVGKTKAPTKAECRRFQDLQEIGCIACYLDGHPRTPGDVHHLIDGYRIGHSATICLCPWHHRSETEGHMAPSRMEWVKGPSLARNKREFVARYGSEQSLLELTDAMLEGHEHRTQLPRIIARGRE